MTGIFLVFLGRFSGLSGKAKKDLESWEKALPLPSLRGSDSGGAGQEKKKKFFLQGWKKAVTFAAPETGNEKRDKRSDARDGLSGR